jgi:hypothetical protein
MRRGSRVIFEDTDLEEWSDVGKNNECQQPLDAGRVKQLESLEEAQPCQHVDFGPMTLHLNLKPTETWVIFLFLVTYYQVYGVLLQQPQENKMSPMNLT